ncbi:MAG: translation elongation factor Ts [Cytophagales bacterium]|nr:translation elongation factor Ts [Cytophagales bacterium]
MSVNISAKEVNELRQKTGSGMMDCKKALVEAGGDFDKAIDILRKKGQKVSAARSNRETCEGVVIYKISPNEDKASILSFTCETDFVAKNEEFQGLAEKILDIAFENNLNSIDDILKSDLNSNSVEKNIVNLIGKIGEKIEIRDYQTLSGEKIVPYIHAGDKLGVFVSLVNTSSVDYVSAGKDVAMQIAAMNPIALNKDGVDQSVIEKEIEIGKEQALKEGKPENIIEKIAQGKLQKFFKENTLLSQPFVKDNSLTVEKYLGSYSSDFTVDKFIRVSIG